MATEIRTEILINASPVKVWQVLTDFEKYSKWNPFIRSLTGQVEVGNKITVRIEPPEAGGMTFRPTILAFEPERELRWLGKVLVTGLFNGEHRFEVVENGNGTTKFIQSEKFTGILVPLLAGQLRNTRRGFEQMNQKLKEVAERTSC